MNKNIIKSVKVHVWNNQIICVNSVFFTVSLYFSFSSSLGLGTSTSKEAKEYFSDMERHKIPFKYTGAEDDAAINLVSSADFLFQDAQMYTVN